MTAPGMIAAMAVPSLGAIELMKPAARALPAPGMFFATIVGWPGMWRPRWRASVARIDVVAAAGRCADEEIDILAGEGVRGGSRRRCEQCGRDHAGADCC